MSEIIEEAAVAREEEKRRSSSRRRARSSAKRKSDADQPKSAKSSNPVIRYFQDTADELRKVKWPTQEEAVRLSLIVLSTMTVSIIALGGFDFALQNLLRPLLSLGS